MPRKVSYPQNGGKQQPATPCTHQPPVLWWSFWNYSIFFFVFNILLDFQNVFQIYGTTRDFIFPRIFLTFQQRCWSEQWADLKCKISGDIRKVQLICHSMILQVFMATTKSTRYFSQHSTVWEAITYLIEAGLRSVSPYHSHYTHSDSDSYWISHKLATNIDRLVNEFMVPESRTDKYIKFFTEWSWSCTLVDTFWSTDTEDRWQLGRIL